MLGVFLTFEALKINKVLTVVPLSSHSYRDVKQSKYPNV